MTSKKELRLALSASNTTADHYLTNWHESAHKLNAAQKELDAFKKENTYLADALEHSGQHANRLATFLDDILTIEPQLKHLLTFGTWDFERVHRAAEALRDEDALASVGYTDQCVEVPDN